MYNHSQELAKRVRDVDNVVFDVGNVLFRFDTDHIREKFLSPENRQKLGDAMFVNDHEWCWGQFDKGLWPDEEVAKRIAAHAGLPECWEEVLSAYEHFHEDRVQLPLVSEIPALKAQGKKIYALTNYGKTGFDRVYAKFDFFKLFDGAVVSGREQMWKPERNIFRLIRDRYQLDVKRTLFIDDSLPNIITAGEEGFQTWHYTEGISIG